MINEFNKIMGPPDKTIVVIGDYSDTGLKGTKSAITKKWRKIYKRHGYQVYLINEYNTSKISNCCENLAENFIKRTHTKNKGKRNAKLAYEEQSGNKSLVWKLIRCKVCKSIHNRDSNAVKNMLKIIESHLKGFPRPKVYSPMEEKKIPQKCKKRIIVEV